MNKTILKEKTKGYTDVYVDASYDWKDNKKREGKICIFLDNEPEIEKVSCPEIDGLKQYTNLMELAAIRNGIERALKKYPRRPVRVISDSKTAISWAMRGNNNLDQFSEFHYRIKNEIDSLRRENHVKVEWISRDENLAGIKLDEEKDG